MGDGSLVLLTVHGIGFQQPPRDGVEGYADQLHKRLKEELAGLLGDDPVRKGGPVYVESEFKGSPRDGLARLDPEKPLAEGGRIAHVALVYSPSLPLSPGLGSVADTLARAALAHGNYTTMLGALRLIFGDAWAALHHAQPSAGQSTLRPRVDLSLRNLHHGPFARFHSQRQAKPAAPPPSPGVLDVVRALEDDVATYVVRNDVRERVRSFVEEATLALLDRPDVEGLVVNAHSQGTLICWDVLCRLPLRRGTGKSYARKLRSFVTAGSPIRKYVDLFAWGELVGELAALLPDQPSTIWRNVWDSHDPVADPLNAASAWRPGQPLSKRPEGDMGLLVGRDPATGSRWHVRVDDRSVDNLRNSVDGGLKAHNYWDNQSEFVQPLAEHLRSGAPPFPVN
jgi:hypothetical protein